MKMKVVLVTGIIVLGLSSVAYNQRLPDGPARQCLTDLFITVPNLLQCLFEGNSINVSSWENIYIHEY